MYELKSLCFRYNHIYIYFCKEFTIIFNFFVDIFKYFKITILTLILYMIIF